MLIKVLVSAEESDIRKLGIAALRQHPTPRNRKLLQSLLHDEDDSIKESAEEVQKSWDNLVTTSP